MCWSRQKKDRLQYPCIPSVIQPVTHSADMPILEPPKKYEIVRHYVEEEKFIRPGTSHDLDFEVEDLKELHRINQAELIEPRKEILTCQRRKAELLASRLQQ
ncbi:hypothetical protein TNCT_272971 [Trichonephila clavata]|uniref:Uncharacterized protein n=1 Tax=Trichonephila clavata TaxID=2740835 RepID=A0A8X6HA97_TRICU|nr:hypothetical protein TNCT_272971 [Trichonephila clavata]